MSSEKIKKGDPILQVSGLNVDFFVEDEWFPAAVDVSWEIHAGEVLAIVGESGSGKTQSTMALVGLLPSNGRVSGSAMLGERELVGMPKRRLRHVRGQEIAMIFQEPMTALNPVYTIGDQIVETIRTHNDVGPKEARRRALELLEMVEIPEPGRRIDSYPHQLSGGQRQRAMIAQSLSCDPKLLVADEPTTALDVTVQAEILELMRDLRSRIDSGIILITHDMGVVADMADNIVVMRNGRIVEKGSSHEIFHAPQHPYTIELLSSVPHLGAYSREEVQTASGEKVIGLEVNEPAPETAVGNVAANAPVGVELACRARNMTVEYPKRGRQAAFKAVDSVSFEIGRGEVLGLVGESGSGKTTIGRAIVGLLPIKHGELEVGGISMVGATRKQMAPLRAKTGFVFQDPGSSLNPRLPIGESIGEPCYLHLGLRGAALASRVEDLLDQVELSRSMRNRYPHELSGGQRQRVGIARALSLEPALLIADEPTSALDVSVQAKVLELFRDLQHEHGFACLFISHDLAVVESLSNRIAVMHEGRLVEVGSTAQVVLNPQDDYTRRLISAVPVPDPEEQRERRLTHRRAVADYKASREAGQE